MLENSKLILYIELKKSNEQTSEKNHEQYFITINLPKLFKISISNDYITNRRNNAEKSW